VHGPHHQAVAARRLERFQVGEGAAEGARVARQPAAGAHVRRRDLRERRHRAAVAIHPERRVGDVEPVVRIERDADAVDAVAAGVDQPRQALHVGMGAGDGQGGRRPAAVGQRRQIAGGQVAEIVLRIDHEQVQVVAHGRSPGSGWT